MPGRQVLNPVLAALQDTGIDAALGGSGLLAALGPTDRVRDWDVTSDADLHLVQDALTAAAIPFTPQPSGDGHWQGLPLADPAVWAQTYRLIGRLEPANALDEWLTAPPTSQQ